MNELKKKNTIKKNIYKFIFLDNKYIIYVKSIIIKYHN